MAHTPKPEKPLHEQVPILYLHTSPSKALLCSNTPNKGHSLTQHLDSLAAPSSPSTSAPNQTTGSSTKNSSATIPLSSQKSSTPKTRTPAPRNPTAYPTPTMPPSNSSSAGSTRALCDIPCPSKKSAPS